MITVGIIANPASGHDIRRLVAHASVFGNDEKVRIVRRIIAGLETVGVERLLIMPDSYGIGYRALDGRTPRLTTEILEMPTEFEQEDSTEAARRMAAAGVGCIITLGGDGTNRAATKGNRETPMLPISTGTNNVFPIIIEATTGGLAAGLVAIGLADAAVSSAPCIEVFRGDAGSPPTADAAPDDLALVDAAVYDESFVGSKAIWDAARISHLIVTRAEPGTIGLSSIPAHLCADQLPAGHGVYLRLAAEGRPVVAPIGPGLFQQVYVGGQRVLRPCELVKVHRDRPWVLALDGERDMEFRAGQSAWLRVNPRGPQVVDPRQAIALGVKAGFFSPTPRA